MQGCKFDNYCYASLYAQEIQRRLKITLATLFNNKLLIWIQIINYWN